MIPQEFHSKFKSVRSVVENAISHIKNWKICKNLFRIRFIEDNWLRVQSYHHKVWVVACSLVNIYTVPLRIVCKETTTLD